MLHRSINYSIVAVCLAIVFGAATLSAQDADSAISHAQALSRAFRVAAESVSPSVVTIRSKFKLDRDDRAAAMNELLQDPRFRGIFPDGRPPFPIPGQEGDEPGIGEQIGSGVVIDRAGIIL